MWKALEKAMHSEFEIEIFVDIALSNWKIFLFGLIFKIIEIFLIRFPFIFYVFLILIDLDILIMSLL
jgi:hypothetical protein